ncbi:T9SS type A sorting domain-containing protein [bacterium]|nr:T9SS type A sorting domain-containing protein [bacterium]
MKSFLRTLGISIIGILSITAASFAASVTFSINMNIQQQLGLFTFGTDMVVARGNFNNWTGNTEVCTDSNNDGIYEGTFTIDNTTFPNLEYKFVMIVGGTDNWESVPNRTADIAAGGTIVIPTVYFNDQSSTGQNADITFQVNMSVQTAVGNFNPANGDKIVLRGTMNGWGGYADELIEDTFNPGHYAFTKTMNGVPGSIPEYKFVHAVPDSAGGFVDNWESVNNRTFTFTGSNLTIPEVYFNDVGPNDIITQNVTVYWRVNVANAIDFTTGQPFPAINSVYIAGFFNNWPWDAFDPQDQLKDDGVFPDATAGDNIYTGSHTFPTGADKVQFYKYSINGPDNENGFAMNHQVTINDAASTYWPAIDNFGVIIDVNENSNPGVIETSILTNNYPNPFNPSTNIQFTAKESGLTKITIYNAVGQEINAFELGKTQSGSVTWNGTDFNNNQVGSGVYFYKVAVGNYSKVAKMTLVK